MPNNSNLGFIIEWAVLRIGFQQIYTDKLIFYCNQGNKTGLDINTFIMTNIHQEECENNSNYIAGNISEAVKNDTYNLNAK